MIKTQLRFKSKCKANKYNTLDVFIFYLFKMYLKIYVKIVILNLTISLKFI
jgi:hypothetical protein